MDTPSPPTLLGHTRDGRAVHEHAVGVEPGVVLHVLDLGATVHRMIVTDGRGQRRDVALGLAGAIDYAEGRAAVGGTIGRYANRIAHGRFTLDGAVHQVATEPGEHHLHGGPDGFHRRTWTVLEHGLDRIRLGLTSPDGDQGYPGTVEAEATYSVGEGFVELVLEATADAPTLVNLTTHVYLNLGDAPTVEDHLLSVEADAFTPVDTGAIPTGGVTPVDGTPFDLRRPTRIGDVLASDHPQVVQAGGLDHDLVVRGEGLREVARVLDPSSRTAMTLWADAPDVQIYTAQDFESPSARDGGTYPPLAGLALEPQVPPDSPNRPDVPSAVLRPGERYRRTVRWVFSTT